MSIVLKELKINGSNIINDDTPLGNKLEIDVSSGISENLKADLIALERNYPKLLRYITIKNNGGRPGDAQSLLSILVNARTHSEIGIEHLEIQSEHKEDFIIDSSIFEHFDLKRLYLKNTNPKELARVEMVGTGIQMEKLGLSGFDLASLDVNGFRCKRLDIIDRYANINQIQNAKKLVGIGARNLDVTSFRGVLDYIKTNKNIAAFEVNSVDLSSIDIFEELKDSEIIELGLDNNKLKSLKGADQLFFTNLTVSNNEIGAKDVPYINKCIEKNPNIIIDLDNNNRVLNSELATLQGGKTLSDLTLLRIREDNYIKPEEEVKDPLRFIVSDPLIPISIKDAEIIRGKANILHNPIEFDADLDIETFDFEKDYLKDGTLLLTVEQAEKLAKTGKKIPMKIGISIDNVSELSVEKLGELVKSIGVSEIRMIGTDRNRDTKYPYTPAQYRIAREKLEEVVSGIDPKESDLDKFATIYTRLAHMSYDYDAIGNSTKAELLKTNELRHSSRMLLNGLRDKNTCVCAGYAEILRNAAALVGIKARYISGKVGENGHAWTEVELADESGKKNKYWADLTWDNMGKWRESGRSDAYDFRYFLIGEKAFKEGHESYFNNGVASNHEEYDREKVKEALEKARKRDIYKRNEKALIADPSTKKTTPPEPPEPPKPPIPPSKVSYGSEITQVLSDIEVLLRECNDIYKDSMTKNPDTVGYAKPQPLVFRDGSNRPQNITQPNPTKDTSNKNPDKSSPRERNIDDDDEER